MERCKKIYEHPLFQDSMTRIDNAEKDRIFCLHGIPHSLDTARIGYIMILEGRYNISKELFYAAALLHDSGRYNPILEDHAEAGAINAELIMPDCGFSAYETAEVANAIRAHRNNSSKTVFGEILYKADKQSRLCFDCKAQEQCYWSDEKRNKEIHI